jgi:hypothetical protein
MTQPIADIIHRLESTAARYSDTDSPLGPLCAEAADYLDSLSVAITEACTAVERSGVLTFAEDGSSGGMSPDAVRAVYATLHEAVTPCREPDEADYDGKYQRP